MEICGGEKWQEAVTDLPYSGEEIAVEVSVTEPGPRNKATRMKNLDLVTLECSVDDEVIATLPLVETFDEQWTGERETSIGEDPADTLDAPQGKSEKYNRLMPL